MYVGHITLSKPLFIDKDAVSDAIDTLISALRMNGQICGREFPTAVTPSGYVTTMFLPEPDALNSKHHNSYVRQALQKLRVAGFAEPEYAVDEELDGGESCSCKFSQSFVLQTNYLMLAPPLHCGNCWLPVPLYRIPPTKEDEYYDIICWQSDYQSCDRLQMNCSTLERAAMRQIARLDSKLSRFGLAICSHIYELTSVPTYYYLHRYAARSRKQEERRLCPCCSGEWLLADPWHMFNFKCDKCCLVSNIAWYVQ